jgi:hypothetical protein
VKQINFLHPSVFIAETNNKGRGVFTKQALGKKILLETAPVVIMSSRERSLLDQTLLHDYIFEWGESKDQCCMALGYIPLYNHAFEANCDYEMDFKKNIITIKTLKTISANAELFINYLGDDHTRKSLWFKAK